MGRTHASGVNIINVREARTGPHLHLQTGADAAMLSSPGSARLPSLRAGQRWGGYSTGGDAEEFEFLGGPSICVFVA